MPYPYLIRESARAKLVRLKYTPQDGLVVVVPRGYDRRRIPPIIDRERRWIEKARASAEQQRLLLAGQAPPVLPAVIIMRAIGEEWDVAYGHGARSHARENVDAGRLDVKADGRQRQIDALRAWTGRKARSRLVPWLRQLSDEHGLPFGLTAVRRQRTRWASCSPKDTISINMKLIFLPALLVEYVFVHELCHTRELNHSRRFWRLVAGLEPDYRRLDRELRQAWRYVPWWMCEPGSGELNQSHHEARSSALPSS
jgi:hypothetical protein